MLDVLLSSPQPARISELVDYANATARKHWQPKLLKDEVQPLFVNRLVPEHILRPWPRRIRDSEGLNKPLNNWVSV